jgi:hypothetical protein
VRERPFTEPAMSTEVRTKWTELPELDDSVSYIVSAAFREKAGGRYADGFFLQLPAQFPVPSRV